MKIRLNGTLLENNNPLVVAEWVKAGYKDVEEVKALTETEVPKPKRSRKKAEPKTEL